MELRLLEVQNNQPLRDKKKIKNPSAVLATRSRTHWITVLSVSIGSKTSHKLQVCFRSNPKGKNISKV